MFMFRLSFFFFKQKTAYEMRISDWSSDVCSSDLQTGGVSGDTVGVDPGKRCAAAIWRDVALSPGRPLRNGREECPTSSRTPPVQEAMALMVAMSRYPGNWRT